MTNKIIHKTGVLKSVISINESYISKIENVLFDEVSGRPILTKTTNEYGATQYTLSHPAHWEYEGMGHAYKNINLEFKIDLTLTNADYRKTLYKATVPSAAVNIMEPGDEFIVRATVDGVTKNSKGTFITENENQPNECIFYIKFPFYGKTEVPTTINDVYFKLYRSGRRNHFMQDVGSITTLNVHPIDDVVAGPSLSYVSEVTGQNVDVNSKKIPTGVLNISAVTYRDNWESDIGARGRTFAYGTVLEDMNYGMMWSNLNENPYMTGEQGIWRPYQTYLYNGDRKQSKNSLNEKEVSLSKDGIMEDVVLFNWSIPYFYKFIPTWVASGEVTRYNEYGNIIESIDKLGIYSSNLYGYKKDYVIATGVNSSYYELGAEDFERFKTEGNYRNSVMRKEGNLSFYNHNFPGDDLTSSYMLDKFKIIDGNVNNGLSVLIETPDNYNWSYDNGYSSNVQNLFFSINDSKNHSRLFDKWIGHVDVDETSYPGKTLLSISADELGSSSLNSPNSISYLSDGPVSGYITVYRWKDGAEDRSIDGAVDFTDEYAHTGTKSMKIIANTAPKFNHTRLDLVTGKSYIMSCWVRRDNANVPFYEDFEILFTDNVNITVSQNLKIGKMVNGWQKVEAELTATYGNLVFTKISSGGSDLYVDDIRVSPKTGGITTYVYDHVNYRLKAILDGNNYATFYFYDEKGNLHLTKKETEEGIFTISENHSHFRTN